MASNCLPAFQNEMLQRPAAELTLNSSSTGKHHNDDNCQQQLKTVQEYLHCGQHYQQPLTIDTKTFNNTVDSNQLDVEHIRTEEYEQTPNASYSSTLEDFETKFSPTGDDQFAYLRNLNSDNLMKFSQQSALQEMLNDQINIKPNINMLPTYEEHDQAGYNFRINVNTTERRILRGSSKTSSVVYSEVLNKLYVRMNENVCIDAQYTLKMPLQPLRLRVFMVYSKDVSEPVLRCQNHLCKDDNENLIIKQSLIRCENSDAEYCGSEFGKDVKERLSVVIPLNSCVKCEDKTNENQNPNSNSNSNQVKKQMLFNFTCNNSCMGRRETTAVFILENFSGEILSQKLLHVKICTCPRRDKCSDEKPNAGPIKRRNGNVFGEDNAKMLKLEEDTSMYSKDDYSRSRSSFCEDTEEYNEEPFDIHREQDKFVLTVKFSSRHKILEVIEQLYANAKKDEFFHQKPCDSRSFKRFYAKVLALK